MISIKRALSAALLSLASLCAAHAQTVVQVNHGAITLSNSSTSSGSATFGSNVTAGNTLIAAYTYRDTQLSPTSTSTISDTKANSWTLVDGPCITTAATGGGRNNETYVYTATANSNGADTVSVSISSGQAIKGGAVFVFEASNASPSPTTVTCGGNSLTTSITTATSLTFTGSPLLIGTINWNASACSLTHSAGTWTTVQENTANSEFDVFYATSGVTSPTSFPATCSTGGAVQTPNSVLGDSFAFVASNGTPMLPLLGVGK